MFAGTVGLLKSLQQFDNHMEVKLTSIEINLNKEPNSFLILLFTNLLFLVLVVFLMIGGIARITKGLVRAEGLIRDENRHYNPIMGLSNH